MSATATRRRQGGKGKPFTPERARELARQRAGKGTLPREDGDGAPDIVTSPSVITTIGTHWPDLLGESWRSWHVALKVLRGEPLDDAEMAVYREHTGRTRLPDRPPRECWIITGRRSGKSLFAGALNGVLLATSFDVSTLARGEKPLVAIRAADREQAGIIFGYAKGLLESSPTLKRMMLRPTRDTLPLKNGVTIQIQTASFRAARGYTLVASLNDEVSFWRSDDGSSNPDREILSAIRPALLTTRGPMINTTTPYSRTGCAWEAFRDCYGRDDASTLVWKGSSASMNPTLPLEDIEAALKADPEGAKAEYLGEFRSDVESFISYELLSAVVMQGCAELPWKEGVRYVAFVDPSGGSQDSMTMAVAHREGRDEAVLDCVREVMPPFSPEAVVADFARTLKDYRVRQVRGDAYGGEFAREPFRKLGVDYRLSERTRSELYLMLLPMIASKRARLLDQDRMLRQFRSLERRAGHSGKDSVGHPPRMHDDVANAAAGALVLAGAGTQSGGAVFAMPSRRVSPEMRWLVDGLRSVTPVPGRSGFPGHSSSMGGRHPHEVD